MDHIVYLDTKANELEKILTWEKTMIIRWAAWRKMPYGRVEKWDILHFIKNNGEWLIKAKAQIKTLFESEKMEKQESIDLVKNNQDKLQLTDLQFKKWAWKNI